MSGSNPWTTFGRNYNESVKVFEDKTKDTFVAYLNKSIVGFIIIDMQGSFTGYIKSLAVSPDYRSKGIGSKLIKFAEQYIFKRAPNVFICASSFNRRAQKLYYRLGYKKVGKIKDYIIKGHSEILLRKSISTLSDFKENERKYN